MEFEKVKFDVATFGKKLAVFVSRPLITWTVF